jgi:hypothetical protein
MAYASRAITKYGNASLQWRTGNASPNQMASGYVDPNDVESSSYGKGQENS